MPSSALEFRIWTYSFSIAQNASTGAAVGGVSATDADAGKVVADRSFGGLHLNPSLPRRSAVSQPS